MIKIKNRKNDNLANRRNQTLNTAMPLRSKLMKGFNLTNKDFSMRCQENAVLDKKSGSAHVKRLE